MEDISIYFQPITLDLNQDESLIASKVILHTEAGFPEISKKGLALIYVPEYRGSEFLNNDFEINVFRNYFYNLNLGKDWNFDIYDLGTIEPGNQKEDTYFALSNVITALLKENVLPIVIGGSQDLIFPIYKGYVPLEQQLNICNVDYKFDLGLPENSMDAQGYVSQLLIERPCLLFNYALIGSQNPYVSQAELALMDQLYFDVCRLGEFNANFKKAEPHLRNADLISIDLMSLRRSEVGGLYKQPNGFYLDQMCQIAKYAGISDKSTVFGLFNLLSSKEEPMDKAVLAEIIWYFIDGYANRKGDFPVGIKKDYIQFNVIMDEIAQEIKFYKSNKSERWWMEVPYPENEGSSYQRHHMVPCGMDDYQLAMKGEIPDLWWKTFQKLMQ